MKPRYLFFLRISERKTASHFCWKCKLFLCRITQRKTASHFCWKCSLEWVYSFWLPPTTNLH
ncbi:hypothetical protein BRY73_06970 [Ochrobactrum sp. P6BS-III]|nr:hypothetical protein BRY73_06970 [Ochrobactrum sp. P6BS-III]